ncbi:hypothetical protein [Roseateles sp. P5_E7]
MRVFAALRLALAWTVLAGLASPALAMDDTEMEAAKADVYRVAATAEEGLSQIKGTLEIRQRVDRLMESPAWPELSLRTRQQALAYFGSGSERLGFDKPSDVLAKMQRWFPAELVQARQARSAKPLPWPVGPAANWEAEPAAFVALWACMPGGAWWAPEQVAFDESMRTLVEALPVAAQAFGPESLRFSECLGRLEARYSPAEARLRHGPAASQRLAEHLAGKFARTLDAQGCTGRGPDDCVLLLSLWADVLPADPALAAALGRLDAELKRLAPSLRGAVASRAALAALQQQPDGRAGDFMRDVIGRSLARSLVAPESAALMERFEPLQVLNLLWPQRRAALVGALLAAEREGGGCPRLPQNMLSDDSPQAGELRNDYALQRLRAHPMDDRPLCMSPDFPRLRQDNDAQTRHMRAALLATLPYLPRGLQAELLQGFLPDAAECRRSAPERAGWLLTVCERRSARPEPSR